MLAGCDETPARNTDEGRPRFRPWLLVGIRARRKDPFGLRLGLVGANLRFFTGTLTTIRLGHPPKIRLKSPGPERTIGPMRSAATYFWFYFFSPFTNGAGDRF